MNADPHRLHELLTLATPEERDLVLRFLLGKRTAEMGRASPHLDLFLGELQVELPGAVDLLGDLRFHLGHTLHSDVLQWARGKVDAGPLYERILVKFQALFCRD